LEEWEKRGRKLQPDRARKKSTWEVVEKKKQVNNLSDRNTKKRQRKEKKIFLGAQEKTT